MANLTCKLYHLWISPFHEMANITYETTAMIWKLKGTIKVENWKRKKDYNNNNMTIIGLRDDE